MARFYNPSSGAGGDVSFTGEGCIVFPNDGEVCNTANSSGDGYGLSTISINPDTTTGDNRYIIIDPTAPNHIHMRAGGTQDESSADLFLGGERNNVRVSDSGRDVVINARPAPVINTYTNENPTSNTNFIISNTASIYIGDTVFAPGGDTVTVDSVTSDSPSAGLQTVTANLNGTPAQFVGGAAHTFIHEESWNHSWLFNDDGVLTGPAMGSVAVNGIFNNFTDDLYIGSSEAIVLTGSNGEFLNDSSVPSNQIATIGDVDTATDKAYISLYSTADQGPFTANTIQPFTYTNVDFSNDISLVEGSLITFAKAGKYNLAFSAQFHQTNSSGILNIWLRKNGNNIPLTNTKCSITSNNPYYVAAWNFFIDAAVGDDFELIWSSDSPNTKVEYDTATGSGATEHPSIPSIILTVNQID